MPEAVSIVVPIYRSAEILPKLVARINEALIPLNPDLELILVNDASPDGSWAAIEAAAAQYPWVRGIDLMRNFGQHNALLCGIRAARNPIVVTMDDDLQHPPEEVPKLLAELERGHDVVYGTPEQQQHGLWRDISSFVIKESIATAMGVNVARTVSAFRAFRTSLRDGFASYSAPYVSVDVLLSWATTNFSAIPVTHMERESGVSNYRFRSLVRHALNMMTGFSLVPLRVATFAGFFFSLFGLGVLCYVLGRYAIEGHSVAGFPFLASTIAIFSGVQLFALGVIGEYLGRVHFQVIGRPTYAVRKSVSGRDA
jgi:undecaprenyl-phosphate 4-deoxy-4-formamido-L-arabinose transferase